MLDQDPQAGWITERELLRDELTAARDLDGRLRRGPGRRPDGVLVRANRQQEAVEVELTPKRDRTEYDRKLSWYLGQMHYQRVHWFAPQLHLARTTVASNSRAAHGRLCESDAVATRTRLPTRRETESDAVRRTGSEQLPVTSRAPGTQPHSGPTAPAGGSQPAQARVLHSARSSLRFAPPGDSRRRSQYELLEVVSPPLPLKSPCKFVSAKESSSNVTSAYTHATPARLGASLAHLARTAH